MKYIRVGFVGAVCAYFWYCARTYTMGYFDDGLTSHFLDNINLIFHEAGHTIFFFMGDFMQIFMGSGFQVLLPLSIATYFFFRDQKISGSICLLWVGQNLLNVSMYAGDAINRNLTLLGGDADNMNHDWYQMLLRINKLKYTYVIASDIYKVGIMFLSIGTVLAIYFAWTKNNSEPEKITSF